ncbi:uncharacterized protein LOC113540011 [Pangasianodon hypophthalmus]|uniref:uncharacterized protein LOC113540011 n=1 Tax=Pangasianodon hypophthalmus TaxID=310915 RepID=UPI002307F602|nr:uncharacterized protein LOC113540011 [Pangasianodon hypophthalmus]XP_053089603.1 uncharacterized protein LOC113540011 [Pangasianodon hypophthalmus]XP_053089604.1 uncharacterized protein LOC113540011 [Pangasianodon hypophthalmus]
MFPDLVRFTWKAKDQRGSILELKDAEQLEQRDENPVQITSMLIIDQHKAMNNKFTCSVQHDSSFKDNEVDIPKEVTQKSNANITCPSPKAEEEDEEEPMNTGLFELSRSLHLFSVTYVILLVKNVLYFCTVSVLLYKRNSANMEMFKSKAR